MVAALSHLRYLHETKSILNLQNTFGKSSSFGPNVKKNIDEVRPCARLTKKHYNDIINDENMF